MGVHEPVTNKVLADVVGFCRDHGVEEATLQIAPDLLPPDWTDLCREFGLQRAPSDWVKLVGDVDTVIAQAKTLADDTSQVEIEPVTATDTPEWGTVAMRGFGMPEQHYPAMITSLAQHPQFRAFAVHREGRMVGAAGVRIDGPIGHLFACAVLPEARSRGGQTGLLLARAAREHGATWLAAETGVESPGEHNASLHNLTRVGLTPRYQRPNWQWSATAT